MKTHSTIISIFLVVLAICGLCMVPDLLGDTIVLKGGQSLTGDILAEKETLLYVDIGVTVLTIPKEEILEYEYTKSSEDQAIDVNEAAVDVDELGQPAGQLYKTADLKKTTLEKCVDAVSEAVVKVSSPAGMGSGFFLNEVLAL